LGLIAATLGKVYGQVGIGLPIIVSAIRYFDGVKPLGIITPALPLPWRYRLDYSGFSPILRSYLLGLTFGLIASPMQYTCSSNFIGMGGKYGGFKLRRGIIVILHCWLCFTPNYRRFFYCLAEKLSFPTSMVGWINPVSGVLLIGFGVFLYYPVCCDGGEL
jgi:cytochrome c-type biogenesis protein